MYCKSCGAQNDDNAYKCVQCGAILHEAPVPAVPVPGQTAGGPAIPNYLAQAILVTIFCCLPFGIAAIVFSSQVSSKLAAGDVAGAEQASKNAKTWWWVSFGVGLGWILLWVVFMAIGMFSSMSSW